MVISTSRQPSARPSAVVRPRGPVMQAIRRKPCSTRARVASARDVIDGHGIHLGQAAVNGDDRASAPGQVGQVHEVARGGKNYARHILRHDDVEIPCFLFGVLVGVAQHHRVTGCLCHVFYAAR
jgi:hypothetical protein